MEPGDEHKPAVYFGNRRPNFGAWTNFEFAAHGNRWRLSVADVYFFTSLGSTRRGWPPGKWTAYLDSFYGAGSKHKSDQCGSYGPGFSAIDPQRDIHGDSGPSADDRT